MKQTHTYAPAHPIIHMLTMSMPHVVMRRWLGVERDDRIILFVKLLGAPISCLPKTSHSEGALHNQPLRLVCALELSN